MGKGKKRHVVLLIYFLEKTETNWISVLADRERYVRRIRFVFLFLKIEFIFMKAASGKDIAKPSTIAIPWIYVPMASKLEAAPLKQPRHNGTFHLME